MLARVRCWPRVGVDILDAGRIDPTDTSPKRKRGNDFPSLTLRAGVSHRTARSITVASGPNRAVHVSVASVLVETYSKRREVFTFGWKISWYFATGMRAACTRGDRRCQ